MRESESVKERKREFRHIDIEHKIKQDSEDTPQKPKRKRRTKVELENNKKKECKNANNRLEQLAQAFMMIVKGKPQEKNIAKHKTKKQQKCTGLIATSSDSDNNDDEDEKAKIESSSASSSASASASSSASS